MALIPLSAVSEIYQNGGQYGAIAFVIVVAVTVNNENNNDDDDGDNNNNKHIINNNITVACGENIKLTPIAKQPNSVGPTNPMLILGRF